MSEQITGQMTIDEWLGLEEKNDMKKIKEARR